MSEGGESVVPSLNNERVISDESEKKESASDEILRFFEENDIPLSYEISGILTSELHTGHRYGTEFAIASGKLVRHLVRKPARKLALMDLDDPNVITQRIAEEMMEDGELDKLTIEARMELIRLESEEVQQNPLAHFPNVRIMKKLAEGAGLSQASRLMVDLIAQAASEDLPSEYEFDVDEEGKYLLCKDSEYYLARRIDRTYEDRFGAKCTVYHDKYGDPVFFQKTGSYKVNYERDARGITTNATAITLKTITVNGVNVPPGTLVGLRTNIDDTTNSDRTHLREGINQAYDISTIEAVMPLRLTMFAVDDGEREFVFGEQYTELKSAIGEVPSLNDFETKARGVLGSLNK